MQFKYNVDQAGDFVAPVFTVLAQSEVAEGDDLFPEMLAHLRRRYLEVYSPAVATDWAPERRELCIRERE